MAMLKKRKSKEEIIASIKERIKKSKGQYTDIDQMHDVEDKRFKIKKEPFWRKHKLESMKYQPMSKRGPDKGDLVHSKKTGHKSMNQIEPPDEEEMEEEEEKPAASKKNKKERKNMAIIVISKTMDKKKNR